MDPLSSQANYSYGSVDLGNFRDPSSFRPLDLLPLLRILTHSIDPSYSNTGRTLKRGALAAVQDFRLEAVTPAPRWYNSTLLLALLTLY
jgi:hypothetical protein